MGGDVVRRTVKQVVDWTLAIDELWAKRRRGEGRKDNPDHRWKTLHRFRGQRSNSVALLWISVSLLTLTVIDWSLGTLLP